MRTALRSNPANASALRSGLAIGGLYGWLLTFPTFGPLLFKIAGERAPMLGLLFIATQGAALAFLAILRGQWAYHPSYVRWAGGLLALTTLLFAAAPQYAVRMGAPAVFLMAVLAAYLVLSWSTAFDRLEEPITTVVTALATAHLLVAAVSAAQGLIPEVEAVGLTLIAGLVMVSASAIATGQETEQPAGTAAPPDAVPLTAESMRPLLPGIAFALGAFLVSGVWYEILGTTAAPEWHWRPVVEALTYALGIILFGDQARRGRPGSVALYSLSLLGLGLMAAIGSEGELKTVYRALFQLGLAGANLYYWQYIWRVRLIMGMRKSLGWGLGLSLWLTALSSIAGSLLPLPVTHEMPLLLIGAAVLFLIIPIGSREPVLPVPEAAEPLAATPAEPEAEPATVPMAEAPPEPESPSANTLGGALEPPSALTQSERQVYEHLIKGASDAEIAALLYISRHTVKFHVRNILHKVGVENRKGLLSLLVSRQQTGLPSELTPPE